MYASYELDGDAKQTQEFYKFDAILWQASNEN